MRITTVNAAVTGGGAERVALSLHEEYLARNIDSWLLVGNRNADAAATIEIPNDRYRSIWARPIRYLAESAARRSRTSRDRWWIADRTLRILAEPARYQHVGEGCEDFDHPATSHLLELTPAKPHILHLHNLHGSYFDIRALPALTREVPTVLTLHDTWFLTGHCAHPFECEGWLTGCETCPYLDRYVPLYADASAANFTLKRRVLSESRLAIATPSRWLMDMAERGGALANVRDARVITNGVDTTIFTPGDRLAARQALGIEPDTSVIAIAARDLTANPYKGFGVLEAALEVLASQGVSACVLAIGSEATPRRIGAIEIRPVPFLEERALLAEHYRASDVYVHPARAEVLGLTILEALACGVPAVAANVGGIPEIVVNDHNGLLFASGDSAELARSLAALLGDGDLRARLGASAARDVVARHSLSAQADAYLEFYLDTLHEEVR